jgi:molybdenum-dependent DNA-binding transcriptional regulator ModE
MLLRLMTLSLCLLMLGASYGQSLDSVTEKITNFPSKFFNRIQEKASDLNAKLTKQTQKYLDNLAKREERIKRKIAKLDSTGSSHLFDSTAQQQYTRLSTSGRTDSIVAVSSLHGQYLANLDSTKVGLSFLSQNPQLLGGGNTNPQLSQLQSSLRQVQQIQTKMQNADQVQEFVQQRKTAIGEYLRHLTTLPSGISKEYQGLGQDMYYYNQKIESYRQMLNDPDKMMKQALGWLNNLPSFQRFMRNNSQLATLFGVPNNNGTAQILPGLQTKDELQQMMQGQLSAGGPNAMSTLQNNVQSAQSQMDDLKNKMEKWGPGGSNIDDPNFKPNNQKTKTLLQRIEYGFNVQTSHNSYFPVTSDIGISIGYKLTNSATIGVGAGYKIGWGTSIQHIVLSNQGTGLRSFLDIKLKGSFYISGGYEWNYTTAYSNLVPSSFTQISAATTGRTQSGLIGVSKIVSLQAKYLKKTKVQLLWDFLSYRQMPHTPPILFRMAYSLN